MSGAGTVIWQMLNGSGPEARTCPWAGVETAIVAVGFGMDWT